jgi:hypothetical protein
MLPSLHTTRCAWAKLSRWSCTLTFMCTESTGRALGMRGFSGMFQVLAQKSMLLELMAAQNSCARNWSLI